jgi:hypothetical protein
MMRNAIKFRSRVEENFSLNCQRFVQILNACQTGRARQRFTKEIISDDLRMSCRGGEGGVGSKKGCKVKEGINLHLFACTWSSGG